MSALNEPWTPPAPPVADESVAMDPRVVTAHVVGQLPCPANPPPPDGWRYWKAHEKVPAALGELAAKILQDPKQYPMGAFVQTLCGDEAVAARVEWHDERGRDHARGCFRGVNLMRLRAV